MRDAHGVALVDADGNIRFTAVGGYYGPLTLGYTVTDGRNGFDIGEIEVRVRPVATAYDDAGFTMAEDGNLTIRVERLLSNDLDGDRMIVGQVLAAKNGSVSLSSDGNINFTLPIPISTAAPNSLMSPTRPRAGGPRPRCSSRWRR